MYIRVMYIRPVSVEVLPGCHAYLLERHVSKTDFLHETTRREKEIVSPWWNPVDVVSHAVKRDEIPTQS